MFLSLSFPVHSWSTRIFTAFAITVTAFSPTLQGQEQRWSERQANEWYAKQPWMAGANYISSNAINQLEMWQPETFDPVRIDKELGWGEGIGMTTMRVFLHSLLWKQDAPGFQNRINQFLTIAQKHHIRPIFVLFDSDWEEEPKLGPQHPPIPGVHNSGWVQDPGKSVMLDPKQYPGLQSYVQGVVSAFADDPRILAWDVWNEPHWKDHRNLDVDENPVLKLLPQVFAWARAVHPSQPLTSGLDGWDPTRKEKMNAMEVIQIEQSDIISFHNYDWPERFEAEILDLRQYHRPLFCTEYLARGAGSNIDEILPLSKKYKVAAINWGLVLGKTQTNLPWDSWKRPYVSDKPAVWHHDIFRPDGKPYREREAQLFHQLTGDSSK